MLNTLNETISGSVYFHQKTKELVKFIPQQSIALINHENIDENAAESLIKKKVKAVLNYSSSMSGQFFSIGTLKLLEHNIPVFDVEQPKRLQAIFNQGMTLTIHNKWLWWSTSLDERNRSYSKFEHWLEGKALPTKEQTSTPICSLVDYSMRHINEKIKLSQSNAQQCLRQFTTNTLHFAQKELEELFKPVELPDLNVNLFQKEVVIVTRGKGYIQDLKAIQPYIECNHPILIGVDGGADAIIDCGYIPDIIIGDMDSVSNKALHCGADIIVHAYKDGRAPGYEQINHLDLEPKLFSCFGTSEDAAHLLAYEAGASLIVSIGSHTHMTEFLEKGRKGMGSTLLIRLKIGDRLIDAKGIRRLYKGLSATLTYNKRLSEWTHTCQFE